MTNTNTVRTINRLPIPTWNWLRLNRANVDTAQFLHWGETKTERTEITAKKDETKTELIRLSFADGTSRCHEHVITAQEGANLTVIMDYTSKENAGGFSDIKTTLVAQPYAKIHLVKVQLLGTGFTQIDRTECASADSAEIRVTQVELGGSHIYAEVTGELNGFQSRFKSDTAYFCAKNQHFDFNYVVNHHGQKTDTQMQVKGVVADTATKIYRGTIDFQRGCAGATGDEQEETLLLSPTAINKSIPMILCDEEDVSGTHGATIGRLSADELFYMQSRGISEGAAKAMMSRAKIAAVAHLIPDQSVIDEIGAFLSARQ